LTLDLSVRRGAPLARQEVFELDVIESWPKQTERQAARGARLLPANGHGHLGDGQRDDVAVKSDYELNGSNNLIFDCALGTTQLGFAPSRYRLGRKNHVRDGFHQLSDLIRHQFGGLRDPALRPQLLRDTGILVVLLQGGSGLVRCVDRVACHRSLASSIPGLHYGDVWFIPAILGAAGVLIVAVDLGMMARGTRA
jgi:hypothetical protein